MLDPVVVVACVVFGFLETLDAVFGKLFCCRVVGNVSGQVVECQFSDCIYAGVEVVVEVENRLVGQLDGLLTVSPLSLNTRSVAMSRLALNITPVV